MSIASWSFNRLWPRSKCSTVSSTAQVWMPYQNRITCCQKWISLMITTGRFLKDQIVLVDCFNWTGHRKFCLSYRTRIHYSNILQMYPWGSCHRCWHSLFDVMTINFNTNTWMYCIQQCVGGICPCFTPIAIAVSSLIQRGKGVDTVKTHGKESVIRTNMEIKDIHMPICFYLGFRPTLSMQNYTADDTILSFSVCVE